MEPIEEAKVRAIDAIKAKVQAEIRELVGKEEKENYDNYDYSAVLKSPILTEEEAKEKRKEHFTYMPREVLYNIKDTAIRQKAIRVHRWLYSHALDADFDPPTHIKEKMDEVAAVFKQLREMAGA